MRIFLDTADVREIELWIRHGIVDGLTTNPSILLKDKQFDQQAAAIELCRLMGDKPVSLEVTSNVPTEMVAQGKTLAKLATNVAVKIPVVNEQGHSCLGAVHELAAAGISVNCTAILSFNQAILAAKAGATYVSIFAGRIADEGNDPTTTIRNVRQWLDLWKSPAQIIVGSIRTVYDIQSAALAGAHIITIPPKFLPQMVDHKYTRETVRQFNQDASKALSQLAQVQP
jgi:transaldolase